jgi:nucleotide-binding universal stress UspA family protein
VGGAPAETRQVAKRAEQPLAGHKGHVLNDYLLGSTADRVADHAHCPVMIVK